METSAMPSSSKKSGAAAANRSEFTSVMTLEGHDPRTHPSGERVHDVSSICYFPDGEQMISGSSDKTARRWDLRAGKEIEEAREVCEQKVYAVGVSRDGRWVVTAGGDHYDRAGELKACEVETGIVRTIEGHSGYIESIDISADSSLLVCLSGGSTVQIWELDTGKLVFKITSCFADAIRFSQDSRKLAVKPGVAAWLEVWDVQAQKLDVSTAKCTSWSVSPAPLFWTTGDKTIVANAAFSFKDDSYVGIPTEPWKRPYPEPKTIREFDASTLETVGVPFEGHTSTVSGLALSSDCALLASASWDVIKLWAFESRQLLASFDVQETLTLILSPNSHQLALTRWQDTEIYICDIPPDILATVWPAQEAQPNTSAAKNPRLADLLNSDATRRAVHRKPVISPVTSFTPRPQRPSPTTQQPDFFRYLRTVLLSRTNAHRNDQPRDPLDFPATSPLPRNYSHPVQETAKTRSRMDPHENSRHTTQSSATTSTTFKARLHGLWTGHALPPIIDVPLAQGKERNAAAGAPPKNNGDWIPDEDHVPSRPPSPNLNSQPPPAVQINTGEHGSGRLCGCF